MTHQMRDKDIDEIFITTDHKNTLLHISYLGPTEETFYTRADIVQMLEIIDGRKDGFIKLTNYVREDS